MLFNAPIETMPLSKLRHLQNKRLRQQVANVYNNVPFYRQKFDEAGLKPSDIKGVKDLHKIPL